MIPYFGFVKSTFIDFPGKIASIIFFPGCNFVCPYCHNQELLMPVDTILDAKEKSFLSLDEIISYLIKRKNIIEGVVLSGGEPFLSAYFETVFTSLRELGFKIKIDTNGSFPEKIKSFSPDYYALDVKTIPCLYKNLSSHVFSISDALSAIRIKNIPFELRVTCFKNVLPLENIDEFASLFTSKDTVFLQSGNLSRALDQSSVPYTQDEMNNLKDAILRYTPYVKIRND